MSAKINITVWNEYRHEKQEGHLADLVRQAYPQGIHGAIAGHLRAADIEVRCATLDEPEHGLPDEVLNNTDVLIWWGHIAHAAVSDELVDKIQKRILSGMGLIVLHSGHFSKIFKRMTGTSCSLLWREVGEKERIWTIEPSHPIARGVPSSFVIPHTEMYGERFDIPQDGRIIFMSWYEGGNVFRSGVTFERGHGKVFYFAPGHETFPIFHDPTIIRIIGNAVRWAAPAMYREITCPNAPALETVYTVDPTREG